MNVFEAVPWDSVAANVRDQVDKLTGAQGALLGAGLGAVTTMAALRATNQPMSIPLLIAGALMGAGYGAADKEAIKGF